MGARGDTLREIDTVQGGKRRTACAERAESKATSWGGPVDYQDGGEGLQATWAHNLSLRAGGRRLRRGPLTDGPVDSMHGPRSKKGGHTIQISTFFKKYSFPIQILRPHFFWFFWFLCKILEGAVNDAPARGARAHDARFYLISY